MRNAISCVNDTSTLYGFIIDPHYDQLPAGLITQLAENCKQNLRGQGLSRVQAFLKLLLA